MAGVPAKICSSVDGPPRITGKLWGFKLARERRSMADTAPLDLRRFHLDGVRDTGRIIGEGSYAVVKELEFRGLKCVGKKLHAVLYENASSDWRADMLQR